MGSIMAIRVSSASLGARRQMYQEGRFLLASVDNTGQERNPIKVFNRHFRYKAYVKHADWFIDSLDLIWSHKYLGLDPQTGFKILEYQNPAYAAGKALNSDPREFSNAFTVQLAGCDYACLYCYVPFNVNLNKHQLPGKLFSAEQIVDCFVEMRDNSKIKLNVLRISGGNPTIVPEIIVDILECLKSKALNDVYVWIDSNLSNCTYMKRLGNEFASAISTRNVGIVGCFKGICSSDFERLTGCSRKDYEMQFETAQYLASLGCDFYLYLPALTYVSDFKHYMHPFLERLYLIDPMLPLRLEMLRIYDYPGSIENRSFWGTKGRHFPRIPQTGLFHYWYDILLPEIYDVTPVFCCNARLSSQQIS